MRKPSIPVYWVPSLLTRIFVAYSYENGINTFDTANVYSNGDSERILGKALKEYKIPRENVVIMTKVKLPLRRRAFVVNSRRITQVFFAVQEDGGPPILGGADDHGYVNRHGLSRKVSLSFACGSVRLLLSAALAHLRIGEG